MEGANALSRLQDDFLPMVENLPNISIIPVPGMYPCCVSEVLRRFFKSDRNPCGDWSGGADNLGAVD